jgi:transposase
MNKTFNGLTALIRAELGSNPLSGDVFVFFNRHRNQVKLIVWETDGYGIFHKRLERGTFELPVVSTSIRGAATSWQDLQLILQGIELKSVRFRKRYHRVPPVN